ncbi:hypothetical protein H4582DRAFT_2061101 [Lactarius indigo]|nr:hypothetical protein H4582DRAFT_2061101 [Lactarius indigo]
MSVHRTNKRANLLLDWQIASAGTLGTHFCLANGPLRATLGVGGILDSAWLALGKSEAGATRPQLLGPTQLVYVRVNLKPDSNIHEDQRKERENPVPPLPPPTASTGPGDIDERRRNSPNSGVGGAGDCVGRGSRDVWGGGGGMRNGGDRCPSTVIAKEKGRDTTLIQPHLGKVKGRGWLLSRKIGRIALCLVQSTQRVFVRRLPPFLSGGGGILQYGSASVTRRALYNTAHVQKGMDNGTSGLFLSSSVTLRHCVRGPYCDRGLILALKKQGGCKRGGSVGGVLRVIERAEGRKMGRTTERMKSVDSVAEVGDACDADAVGRHRGVVSRGKEEFFEGGDLRRLGLGASEG